MKRSKKGLITVICLSLFVLSGCGFTSQSISVEGSSTVYPITLEAIHDYDKEYPNSHARIDVASTGTGGGFKLFVKGETEVNDASRAITSDEKKEAKKNNIDYTELQVGIDGITVIINDQNTWAQKLTSEDLKKIFEDDSKISTWSDLDSSFPDKKINLYGPTSASGTYDFFAETILSDENASIRGDMNATENDNEVISNVENDKYGIGFLGYGYYSENKDRVQAVNIDGVSPNSFDIKSGDYVLSRPLYIYVNNQALRDDKSLQEFITYYIDNSQKFATSAGYVGITDKQVKEDQKKVTEILQ